MATYGDDATLMKVAIFGIAMSLICTFGVQIMLVEASSDYDYDDIQAYRNELIAFSGASMVNENPWILTAVYTPWNSSYPDSNVDSDGWLYGESVAYSLDGTSYIGKNANIRLDPDEKSTVPLTYTTDYTEYTIQTGTTWWANIPLISWIGTSLGGDPYTYGTFTANNWNYTGYRYVFDPSMPFKSDTASTVDGALSLVWYSYNNQEGLSGGLDIYGGSILLGSYSATDIIADYNTESGYATRYEFNFEGATLTLSIRFDQSVIESGSTLMQAWSNGNWSMAISSVSAGNLLDTENSASFSTNIGSIVNTFTQIFTFSVPNLNNEWASMMLWMMCGLPMTLAMLCVGLRILNIIIPG